MVSCSVTKRYEDDGVTGIIELTGSLVHSTVQETKTEIQSVFEKAECKRVIIDLRELNTASSDGLGALISAQCTSKVSRKPLILLVKSDSKLFTLMEITQLHTIITVIFDGEIEEAKRKFDESA